MIEVTSLDWRSFVTIVKNKIPLRKRESNSSLADEKLQALEREFENASAQAIVSTDDVTTTLQHINRRRQSASIYDMVEDYSQIVMRSMEINKEVFKMALSIKDDMKEVLKDQVGALRTGVKKGWVVALNMAGWVVFFLVYILFKQFIVSVLGIPLP